MSSKTRLPSRELVGVIGNGFVRAELATKRAKVSDAGNAVLR